MTNRKKLIELARKHPFITRRMVAEAIGQNIHLASAYVSEAVKDGILQEVGKVKSPTGRPVLGYKLRRSQPSKSLSKLSALQRDVYRFRKSIAARYKGFDFRIKRSGRYLHFDVTSPGKA